MTPQPTMPAGEAAPRPRVPLWLLALLTFSGTLAMHVFVPALPLAGQDLGAGPGAMRMTISLYILGLAVGQLVYGPLADRYGRRPVLMVGLTLYAVSGLAALLAPGVQALIAARLFQALGGCAGLVLGRAIVRDLAGPQEAAQRLALMNLMVTLGPGLAPLLGTALAELAGWRSIFVLLCALGVVNLLFTWRMLPETGQRTVQSGATLARNTLRLVRSPVFLGYAVGGGCATTSMYAFVASAPFIFTGRLHRPAHEVGFYLAVLISGVWLGSMVASRLMARRLPITRVLVWANLVSVLGAFVFLGMVLSGQLNVFWTVLPMFVFTLGAGIASPAALTQAISVDPQVIGSASGLYGFTQMAVGAICTALAGIGQDPALAAALILAGAGVISQLSFWMALRPEGGQTPSQGG
ncbi:Bcr/CflA family efflux MFS transporter [Pseudoroseomonas wenyumeiae]|uniref:Bcr/CflA family efflux transporter n=1 Tax=Teichococcus wenyumeiae TaxID=2478470 RepID=A0A3A9JS98_9PROT|nr:multidrug effflux MFS transporter [Pseudoroseomonas wenyumeiae]RKK03578.1 Bcr/CflA family efflux MFS transporter [Pseudoroseomonas wenyumeiae]RMI27123.1 Bcr/CflA family efflux MFS transporter [Pseudoroseomonas wenyumeiae]